MFFLHLVTSVTQAHADSLNIPSSFPWHTLNMSSRLWREKRLGNTSVDNFAVGAQTEGQDAVSCESVIMSISTCKAVAVRGLSERTPETNRADPSQRTTFSGQPGLAVRARN